MKKMCIIRGLAVMALGLIVASCSKLEDSGQTVVSKEEAKANAEEQLGISIDPNQDWKMTRDIQANVSVNLGTGEDYTLILFDKSPFVYDDAVYYAKQEVSDGSNVSLDLTVPSALTNLYITVLDKNGLSYSKRKLISENTIDAAFEAESANARDLAMRRSNTGETYNETSTGINANANEWADPTPGKQFGGWVVPDPLTNKQKEVVRKYFQAVPDLTYTDPQWRHFFVQQVYTGGQANPKTGNEEKNKGADKTNYSSSNMDLLTVGYNNQHINNFNGADASKVKVLDNGYTANDFNQHHHLDQIMLMVNIDDTECMGYHNSGCSQQKNDKAALVDWTVIRDWANSNNLDGDCLEDGWNRSFVGFDFELYSLEDSYAKEGNGDKIYAPLSDVPGNTPQYVWDGSKVLKVSQSASARRFKNRRAGVQVWGGGDIYIQPNLPYNDGDYVYMYNGDNIVGKLIFNGGGNPSVASSAFSDCQAYVERSSFTFKSLIDSDGSNGGQFFIYTKNHVAYKVYDETAQRQLYPQNYNDNGYTADVIGGHTYTISCDGGDKIDLYRIQYYQQGKTLDDDDTNTGEEAGNSGGEQGGSEGNQGSGDNQGGSGDNQGEQEESNDTYNSNYIIVNGEKIPFLSPNMNMYGGVQRSLSDGEMKIYKEGKECLNLPKFIELVEDGYLPVKDKNLRTWVKWGGGDGYFSDWIVTLSQADRIQEQETHIDPPVQNPAVYSYAFEDTYEGDYDLNDVVLKAQENGDNIDISLVAAGATLDLNIRLYDYDENGTNGYGNSYVTLSYNNSDEVHGMLGVDRGIMVNTGGGGSNCANTDIIPTFTVSKSSYDVSKLRLAIYSDSEGEVRLSGSGDTPHGVLIPADWQWPTECTHVNSAYNNKNTNEEDADQSFSTFASQAGKAEKWYNYPTGNVMH